MLDFSFQQRNLSQRVSGTALAAGSADRPLAEEPAASAVPLTA